MSTTANHSTGGSKESVRRKYRDATVSIKSGYDESGMGVKDTGGEAGTRGTVMPVAVVTWRTSANVTGAVS